MTRGFLEECECGRVSAVRNASIVVTTPRDAPACDGPHPHEAPESLVAAELGWCACGNPEDVDAAMLAYLRSRAVPDWPKPDPDGVSVDAAMLLAYIADSLGWTEHGSFVGAAWLSDEGREALRNLAR
jgi:hypothetical protein